jgi:hypothetical protein
MESVEAKTAATVTMELLPLGSLNDATTNRVVSSCCHIAIESHDSSTDQRVWQEHFAIVK